MSEIEKISDLPDFKGYLSDLGGPSANMYRMKGKDMKICSDCSRPSCIWPAVCKNLNTSHKELTELYKKVNRMEGIKKHLSGAVYGMILLFPEWNKSAGRDEGNILKNL